MKEIITKLRMMCSIWRLRLKLFWAEITAPFRFAAKYAERYSELKKIDEESEDRWERHVKLTELKQKDELELRRSQFFLKKTQVIGSFFRTAMNAECFLQFQENPNDVEACKQEFLRKKEELVSLVTELEVYDESAFDEEIKSGILEWEFEQYKTQDEINAWIKSFAEYISTLDII